MAKGKWALGAVIGAVAGFVSGVLLAPKSGKETREDVKKAGVKAKDDIAAEVDKVKTATTKKTQEVKAKTEELVEDVTEKAKEVKARTEQAVAGAKAGFSKDPKSASKKTTKKSSK